MGAANDSGDAEDECAIQHSHEGPETCIFPIIFSRVGFWEMWREQVQPYVRYPARMLPLFAMERSSVFIANTAQHFSTPPFSVRALRATHPPTLLLGDMPASLLPFVVMY